MGILGRHYLHTVVSNFVMKFVIGLVISVATARALGPAGRGEYGLVVLIVNTVTLLFNFGIPSTNTYFIAQKKFGKEHLYRSSVTLACVLSILSFVVLGLLYEFDLSYILFPTEKLTAPIIASLGIIPVVFFNLFAQGIVIGENKIELNNYISLAGQGALALTLGVLYVVGVLSVTSAVVLYAFSHVLTLAMFIRTSCPSLSTIVATRNRWSDYSAMLKFSGTIHIGNLTQFFNYRLDSFIVNFFMGTGAVGLYLQASLLGETLWLLSSSMAWVLLPTVAGRHEKSKEIAVKATVATFLVSIIGGIAAFVAGPWLIVALFGDKFVGSITPFLILIPGVVIFSITNVLATYLTGAGRPGYNAAIAFISFVFTIVFDILLIPRYGIAGAAIASGISYTTSTILTVAVFVRISALSWAESVTIVKSMRGDVRSIVARLRQPIEVGGENSETSKKK